MSFSSVPLEGNGACLTVFSSLPWGEAAGPGGRGKEEENIGKEDGVCGEQGKSRAKLSGHPRL